MKNLTVMLLCLLGLSFACVVQAQANTSVSLNCGPIRGEHYGPYDYRPDFYKHPPLDPMNHAQKRELVEHAHFTVRVESLIGAQSGGRIGPPGKDLSYTLRAFPNNHRALVSVMRYGEKFKTETPPGLQYPVECYFERAIRFAGNDAIVRIIYASYLGQKSRLAEAITQLKSANELARDSGFTHYNIGLAYVELKEYTLALESAHQAMALGFERTELREKLRALGKWQEPVAAPSPVEEPGNAPAAGDSASGLKS